MNKEKCLICGRFSDCFKNKCSYCSRLDFEYSQGTITLKTYLKYMKEWLNEERFKSLNFEVLK